MLGNDVQPLSRIYLTIAKGRIVRTNEDGSKVFYTYVEGRLASIHSKERSFGKERVKYWYLDVQDGEELYSIGLPLYSGVLRSIILSLASEEELSSDTPLRIETYESKGYTKASVYSEGVKLDWVTKQLPPVKELQIGGRIVKDESERDAYIEQLILKIKGQIEKK